uniref:Uncharacterized protein n=1 Tax=Arundo donax TaxID=35708 RepID=A0A0A8Z5D0_ARUDO
MDLVPNEAFFVIVTLIGQLSDLIAALPYLVILRGRKTS